MACLAACTPTPTSTPPPEAFDPTGDWVLESGNLGGVAIPILADHPITFSVEGSQVGGQAACNDYGGRLEFAEGRIRFAEGGMTGMACGGPDSDVMRSEEAFLQALGAVQGARGDEARMTMFGPAVEMVFVRKAPIEVAKVVGTDWILESFTTGDDASLALGGSPLLRLDEDGTFHGGTGCRTFEGTWIQAQGRLVATQATMTGDCPGGLGGQDGAVTAWFDGTTPTLDGDRLTLTINGGIALVYRRAID